MSHIVYDGSTSVDHGIGAAFQVSCSSGYRVPDGRIQINPDLDVLTYDVECMTDMQWDEIYSCESRLLT